MSKIGEGVGKMAGGSTRRRQNTPELALPVVEAAPEAALDPAVGGEPGHRRVEARPVAPEGHVGAVALRVAARAAAAAAAAAAAVRGVRQALAHVLGGAAQPQGAEQGRRAQESARGGGGARAGARHPGLLGAAAVGRWWGGGREKGCAGPWVCGAGAQDKRLSGGGEL